MASAASESHHAPELQEGVHGMLEWLTVVYNWSDEDECLQSYCEQLELMQSGNHNTKLAGILMVHKGVSSLIYI